MTDDQPHLKRADPRAGFRLHSVRLVAPDGAVAWQGYVRGDFSADPATGDRVFNHDLVPGIEAAYEAHESLRAEVEPAPEAEALMRAQLGGGN